MKILIVAQVMDRNDSALGFFQEWAMALSKKFDHTEVICLKEGDHGTSDDVAVHSLGKESASGSRFSKRFGYITRFYRLAWSLRKNYDIVFVHMNQEYILLFGLFWFILGKKVYMWRNHYDGSLLTNIAVAFCTKVFCTSKFSYTAKFKKTVIMPVGVGVDLSRMNESIERIPKSILSLGRLDVSKRPHLLIEALGMLAKEGIDFTASFVGGPSKSDASYSEGLKVQVEKLGISDRVKFVGAVPSTETFRYDRSHEIFVNCSRSGMFDKTIFEAAVYGCLVLVNSQDFKDLAGEEFFCIDGDVNDLARKLKEFLSLAPGESTRLRNKLSEAVKNHSLPILMERLREEMTISESDRRRPGK